MAAVDYFLKLDGIDGESADAAFAKNIDLQSWSWGESNMGGGTGTGGMSAGKVMSQDFHFVSTMSTASAKLLQACAGGTHIANGLLVCRTAGDTPQVYLKIKLVDVLVSSYQTGGSARRHQTDRPGLAQLCPDSLRIRRR